MLSSRKGNLFQTNVKKNKLLYLIILSTLFFLTNCPDNKPDKIIEHSPGPKPAWTTGQKKQDTPDTEYYVGFAQANTKSQSRNQAIQDVMIQISRRIMVEIYSIEVSSKYHKNLIRQTLISSTKTILFDLKINQEYFEKKISQKSRVYYDYFVYCAYPTKSLVETKSKIINYLKSLANNALKSYETAMILIKKGKIIESIHNLMDSKRLIKQLSFHSFLIESKKYPEIKNNYILNGYVQRALNKIRSNLHFKKKNITHSPHIFAIYVYYKDHKNTYPIAGARVIFKIKKKIYLIKNTNETGHAQLDLSSLTNNLNRVEVKAFVTLKIQSIEFPFSPNQITYLYKSLSKVDLGVIILEEKINKKNKKILLNKSYLHNKINSLVKELRLSFRTYNILKNRERQMFYKAVNGNHSSLNNFKRLTGGKILLICHLKSIYSSSAMGRFIFYRTNIYIKVFRGNNFTEDYSENILRAKGGSINETRAVFESIQEAVKKISPGLKNYLLK